jgi:hypothetical protein
MHLEQAFAVTSSFAPESFAKFAAHLDPDWIEEALLSTGMATVRRRRLPMEEVVWLVLGMGLMRDLPIVDIVERLDLALPDRSSSRTVAPSAVAQARRRLGADPLEWLFLRSGAQWGVESATRHLWCGLSLYSVDGTTLRIPDSAENRRHFGGQPAGNHGRGDSGYPLVRLAALMALRSHVLVAASFGPYGTDERTYAEDLWPSVPDESLVILDRNYLQANVLVPLAAQGRDRHWLLRAKSNTKWTVLRKLGRGDCLAEKPVSKEARRKQPWLPESFPVRVITYKHKGHAPKILLTSMTDAERFPADEIRKLYHERWEIELGYAELKVELLDNEQTIRSKTPGGVAQEIWGVLLAFNLVRREMERIAEELEVEPTRISFIAALRFIVDQWQWAAITRTPGAIPKRLQDMRDKIRRFVLAPRRPERSYPRAVKVKMSNFPLKRPAKRPLK